MINLFKFLFVGTMLCFSTAGSATPASWWLDITNDRLDAVRSQLAMGEDPNAVNSKGQPSLMLAIQEGAWKVYDLLVKHRNIDLNIRNANDETPLMYLSVVGETKRAADLIKKGAEVNRLGWTPLHYAASKAHLDTVRLLLANKAIVNAPSPDGTSPLMMAAYAGNEEIVRVLLAAGADPTARNLRGEDAADWARRRNHGSLGKQLDDLTERVLKSRRAGGPPPVSGPAAPGASAPVFTLEPTGPRSGAKPSGTAGSAASSVEAPQESGSASRYFDLNRFERDDDRF